MAASLQIGLVRSVEGGEVSRARTWSVRLSVDDMNAALCLLETDEEIAAWTRGLLRGLNGGDCKQGASKPYAEGWEIGFPAREKADEIRAERAEIGSVGGSKRVANAQAIASPNGQPIGKPTGQPERRTKNVERKNKEQEPPAPSRDEWNDHAAAAFPWWPRHDIDKGWDYWESRKFIREGKTKRSDWKRLMGSWAGKWGEQHPREVAAASAPRLQIGDRIMPAGFRPMGKAVPV